MSDCNLKLSSTQKKLSKGTENNSLHLYKLFAGKKSGLLEMIVERMAATMSFPPKIVSQRAAGLWSSLALMLQ